MKNLEQLQMTEEEFSNNVVNKNLQCETCNYFFKTKETLKRHITSVHEGKKPFKCDICTRNFARNAHLLLHVASIHEKIKQHMCTVCGEFFSLANYLKRHVQKVHEGKNTGDLTM